MRVVVMLLSLSPSPASRAPGVSQQEIDRKQNDLRTDGKSNS